MKRRHIPASERLAILERDGGCCYWCGQPIAGKAWDVEHELCLALGGTDEKMDENLRPIHRKKCHPAKTAEDAKKIAKAKRMQQRSAGIPRQSRHPLPGGRNDRLKRKVGGGVVPR